MRNKIVLPMERKRMAQWIECNDVWSDFAVFVLVNDLSGEWECKVTYEKIVYKSLRCLMK